MNDLDLRTALHRDADLVGEPSPDLLDQLVRRRQHQRHRRTVMFTAAVAVVVLAGGIPVATSVFARSESGPATQTTVAPTPTPTPTAPPSAPPSAPPIVDVEPVCDFAAVAAALPPDTADHTYALVRGQGEVCSGVWAAAGYTEAELLDGQWWSDGQAGLFRYVDGSWRFMPRDPHCDDAGIPKAVYQRACMVD